MDYFKRTRVSSIILDESVPVGEKPIILGWVRSVRASKNVAFVTVNDGSCIANIQGVVDNPERFTNFNQISTGSSVRMAGKLVESQGKGQKFEILVEELELLGGADESYPMQKKRHGFEYLREIAHLRPRTNTFGAVFRVRSKLSYAIHKYYQERGFYYIHTPIITASDCEGAGEMFKVTTLPFDNTPRSENGSVDYGEDFFSTAAYLTVSGQLEGELFATALGDIYTFGPTFRAEDSHTSRHASEFWMIEPEMAFCELEEDMTVAEDFLKYLFKFALEECPEEMEFFTKWIDKDKNLRQTLESVVEADFVRLPYTEAIEILEKAKKDFEYPVKWGIDMQSEHERYLTEVHFKKPVIVHDYPRSIKPFYMKVNDDGKTVRALDVLVPKVGEIIGGSEREYRRDILEERIRECNLDMDNYGWYLDIRKYGTVPHAGFGLGFERVVMYITGMANIRDVIPFPRVPRWAKF